MTTPFAMDGKTPRTLCADAYVGPCYTPVGRLRRWIGFTLIDLGCRVLGNERGLVLSIAQAMVKWRQRNEA